MLSHRRVERQECDRCLVVILISTDGLAIFSARVSDVMKVVLYCTYYHGIHLSNLTGCYKHMP